MLWFVDGAAIEIGGPRNHMVRCVAIQCTVLCLPLPRWKLPAGELRAWPGSLSLLPVLKLCPVAMAAALLLRSICASTLSLFRHLVCARPVYGLGQCCRSHGPLHYPADHRGWALAICYIWHRWQAAFQWAAASTPLTLAYGCFNLSRPMSPGLEVFGRHSVTNKDHPLQDTHAADFVGTCLGNAVERPQVQVAPCPANNKSQVYIQCLCQSLKGERIRVHHVLATLLQSEIAPLA